MTKIHNEVATRRQPSKNRNYATHKSTQAAKLETLRRKTIRSEKYGSAK